MNQMNSAHQVTKGTKGHQEIPKHLDHLARVLVDAAFKVHTQLGPGLLESAYQRCLEIELSKRGIAFEAEVSLPVIYEGVRVDAPYRLDPLVASELIVELKALDALLPIHRAQLLTYLKLWASGSDC